MKKVLFLCALMLPLMLTAEVRTVDQAAAIAAEFANSNATMLSNSPAPRRASDMRLARTYNKVDSEVPALYVFNHDAGGFVVVSGDDLAAEVLMYSETGSFDANKVNPNFQFWLRRMQEEMSVINEENAAPRRVAAEEVTAIAPLLKNKDGEEIAWYQEKPYWNQCPMDLWKTKERCLTGCVATATAQIMYKWCHPDKGTGSHSYTWECCMNDQCSKTSSQKLSIDFDTVTFDWDNMLANYKGGKSGTEKQQNAVATLMYCCGVACNMGYGGSTIGGSGAWTDDMGYALKTYFRYKVGKFVTTYSKKNYKNVKGAIADVECEWKVSMEQFATYFNSELEAGRPILMGGEDTEGGGHEFVCDGRDKNGKFHINWGWEGDSNCYCLLSSLKPTGASYNFSSEVDAMLGVEPNYDTPVEDIEASTTNAVKAIQNGRLFIHYNGQRYNVLGIIQ